MACSTESKLTLDPVSGNGSLGSKTVNWVELTLCTCFLLIVRNNNGLKQCVLSSHTIKEIYIKEEMGRILMRLPNMLQHGLAEKNPI